MGGGEDATPAHTLPFTVHSRRFLRLWAAAKVRGRSGLTLSCPGLGTHQYP